MGWCFCEKARDVEKLWGRRESPFLGAIFRLHVCYAKKRDQPSNANVPLANISRQGPSSSATSLFTTPGSSTGCLHFNEPIKLQYPISTTVSLVLPGITPAQPVPPI